ncbi:PLP-dependent aminotransferase family protein [Brevibacillus invocatus]
MCTHLLYLTIDRDSPLPLIRQLYTQLRSKILQGELKAGQKLPSTRQAARELCISRNVVIEAFDQLLAEGYIESKQGSGFYVVPDMYLEQQARQEEAWLIPENDLPAAPSLIDFRSGVPALDFFPRTVWGRMVQRVCHEAPLSALGYNRPEGRLELRQILSRYLYRTRGVQCEPEQIVMTSGATQALTLIAKVLLTTNSQVVMEDPITQDIQTIFSSAGASLIPVPTDEAGMMTDLLPDPEQVRPSFVFVTPSHQFPLGGTLPIQRRIQLIQYARQANCYIVEDDYDSEFRYDSPPISSLQGLAAERVIYVGSFSKILSPGLRLGYLVLPPELVHRYQEAKWFTDLHTPSLDQLALGLFIEDGHLEKYLNRVKKLYKKRRKCLSDALTQAFSNKVSIWGASAGLHVVAAFAGVRFTPALLKELEDCGVRLYPVSDHTIQKDKHTEKLIIGYGNLSEEQIMEGVDRLQKGLAVSQARLQPTL